MTQAQSQAPLLNPDDFAHPGAQLRALREHYGWELPAVATHLRIRARYLEAIEQGRFSELPGKVYARGYIAQYAEFLGLEPDDTATRCLGEEAKPEKLREQAYFVPEPKRTRLHRRRFHAGHGLLVGVATLVIVALAMQMRGGASPSADTPQVEDVPEAMTRAMRDRIMPTPHNYACIAGMGHFACVSALACCEVTGWAIKAPPRQFAITEPAPEPVLEALPPSEPVAQTPSAPAPVQAMPEAPPPEAAAKQPPVESAPAKPSVSDAGAVETPARQQETPEKAAAPEKAKEQKPAKEEPQEGKEETTPPTTEAPPSANPEQNAAPASREWWDFEPVDPNARQDALFPRRHRR